MSGRFDEIELLTDVRGPVIVPAPATPIAATTDLSAPRYRRCLTFLADALLFAALFVALLPLAGVVDPYRVGENAMEVWPRVSSVVGFLLLISYFYFAGAWLIWGRTIGGAIFDVRIISDSGIPANIRSASRRWGAMLLSIATGGLGFLLALLRGGRSLADRMSQTRAVSSE